MEREEIMTREEILKEISTLSKRIFNVESRLSQYTDMRVDEVTPYTETKTAYIGDTEVTFYTEQAGNLTVFFDKPYMVERLADRITVSFDELEEVTEITISIL